MMQKSNKNTVILNLATKSSYKQMMAASPADSSATSDETTLAAL